MDFKGKAIKICQIQEGTSARGAWQKQDVIFETIGTQYPRKLCVTFFNKQDEVAKISINSDYNVVFEAESREFNGKWYTNLTARSISLIGLVQPSQVAPQANITPAQDVSSNPYGPRENEDAMPF